MKTRFSIERTCLAADVVKRIKIILKFNFYLCAEYACMMLRLSYSKKSFSIHIFLQILRVIFML